VNCEAVQNVPGADGKNVTVFDVEQGFNFEHEDLIQHEGKLLVGRNTPSSYNHGQAVCGIISGYNNSFGIKGISHNTKINGCSFQGSGSNHPRVGPTIMSCIQFQKPGDIMLYEMHAIGPGGKFIAMDWWPDNYAATKHAVEDKKIIVVMAGGNGNENLDNSIYNRPGQGFPPEWKNPFNRSLADSGGIIIGAGAPPPGTHGGNFGPDRCRLDFSNYGNSIDAQGWGRMVTTVGYGDLFNRGANRIYTNTFSGTSSASPVVVGTIAAMQGITKARGKPLLNSVQVRNILRKTGSPQTDHPNRPKSERIGNRPDLKQLLEELNKL